MPGDADHPSPGAGERAKPSLTVAVIGHVNHGKTALVRALTGIETDRLKDEIERGLSITLGFAWRDYDGCTIEFIDSPGHEDYIRAMVAGATGARAILLVVSAAEGFARQTREHLQIATLLGIQVGLVAMTKADLLSPEDRVVQRTRLEGELKGTILEAAPIVLCSALGAEGLSTLHRCLEELVVRCPSPEFPASAFLSIDRVFTVSGSGTVVTGTLHGGTFRTGAQATLWPSGRKVGLRRIQVHGQSQQVVEPGRRVAANLRGVAAHDVRVGDALCAPNDFEATLQVDVELTVLADARRPLKHMDQVRVLTGARHDMATVRLIGEKSIAQGGRAVGQLRFSAPVIAFAGQCGILRHPSPAETVAGVVVLDPSARILKGRGEHRSVLDAAASGDLDRIVASLCRRDGGLVSLAELARLSRRSMSDARRRLRQGFTEIEAGRWALTTAVAETSQAYLDLVSEAHRNAPARVAAAVGPIRNALSSRAPKDLVAHVERALASVGRLRLEGGWVALPGHDPGASLSPHALARLGQIEAALRADGLKPCSVSALAVDDAEGTDLMRLLIESGRAVSLRNKTLRQTLIFHRDALDSGLALLRDAYAHSEAFTTGEARATLGTTRKYIVPLLEYFDAQGLTERRGDVRQMLPGPGPTAGFGAPADLVSDRTD